MTRLFALVVAASAIGCGRSRTTPPSEAPPDDAPPAAPPAQDLEDVSQWASPHVPIIEPIPGTTGLSAARCGDCHAEIYAEWSASTHAHAWVDPQFQAELKKDPAVGWICLNCHTPLQAQQPEVVTYAGSVREAPREPNPSFDADLREEGITCLTCHWRPGGIAAVHADAVAPHPLVHAPELREATTCTVCHEAQAQVEDTLVCAFSTGTEWEAAGVGKACPECHMPRVERSHATGAPVRDGGRHLWPGSLLPKDAWSEEEAALFADWEPGTDATLAVDAGTATLTLANVRAGHMLPSGDPERHYIVTLTAEAAGGGELARTEARYGQVWEWWPKARRLSDDRIPPGESRSVTLALPAGAAAVVGRVQHVRISDENAEHHDLGAYPRRRTVHELRRELRPRADEEPPVP